MSGITLAAALEAVRLGEATQAHAAALAEALRYLAPRIGLDRLAVDMGDAMVAVLYAERDEARAERDAALEEQRRAVARLAEVSAERDRLLAAAVAQADATTGDTHEDAIVRWMAACEATAALGRELRGGGR